MRSSLEHAIQLRHDGRPQEALQELHQLLQHRPDDPDVNYQTAWTYDSMGEESKAVPHYEAALANGLVHDRDGSIRSYEKALRFYSDKLSQTWD